MFVVQPCIRISSRYEDSEPREAYAVTSAQKKDKSKWVASQDFATVGGQAALNNQEKQFVPNYVTRDPSGPPILHNFRAKADKTKFVSAKSFRIY